MISLEDGRPCVIGFGKSTCGTKEDAYQREYVENRVIKTRTYVEDEVYLAKFEQMMAEYIENNK